MSSDPPISEVTATTGNSSSNRLVNSDFKRREVDANRKIPEDTTTEIGLDAENPRKRMKVEKKGRESNTDKNPLNPVDSNHSKSTGPPQFYQSNFDDNIEVRNNEHHVRSGDIARTDTSTAAALQRGERTGSSDIASPSAVARSSFPSVYKQKDKEISDVSQPKVGNLDPTKESKMRWRVHQMTEDYTNLVGSMMYPATQFQPYGYNPEQRQYPIEKVSLLGFIQSPLRRPTIIEKWSPYEIALFEGSMFHYGKEFRNISRQIGTKTTQEVVDFYYIWKKTEHYKKWKEQYISDEELDDFHIPLKKLK